MNEEHTTLVRRTHPDAILPGYQTSGAICYDLHACLGLGQRLRVHPGEIRPIPTGLAFELPPGWGMDVFARSGLASRGLVLANGIGKIDPDFRGEVQVLVHNVSQDDFIVRHGDRIAQASPIRRVATTFREVDQLSSTERGAGAFGSTGIAHSGG